MPKRDSFDLRLARLRRLIRLLRRTSPRARLPSVTNEGLRFGEHPMPLQRRCMRCRALLPTGDIGQLCVQCRTLHLATLS
jgi:hypothetical protein